MVFETLREANRALEITIVVVEQKVALLSEYCNRVLVLNHGEIALQGEPHEVFARTDELRTIGVDCPRVTRIFNSLETDGLVSGTPCLDVDEAERLITEIVDPDRATSDTRAPAGSPHAPSLRPHAKDAEPVLTFDHVEFSYPPWRRRRSRPQLDALPRRARGHCRPKRSRQNHAHQTAHGFAQARIGQRTRYGLGHGIGSHEPHRTRSGNAFQNPDRQICKDTVLDEVAFGLELAGIDRAEALRRAQLVIDRFWLAGRRGALLALARPATNGGACLRRSG